MGNTFGWRKEEAICRHYSCSKAIAINWSESAFALRWSRIEEKRGLQDLAGSVD
jgi:hypothetical protein